MLSSMLTTGVTSRGLAAAALAAAALAAAACDRARGGADEALAIGELQVELVSFDAQGRPRASDAPLAPRLETALGRARALRLERGAPGAARLRLRAQLSPDRAAGELHAMLSARVDRTVTIPLSWEIDRRSPLGPGGAEPPAAARDELLGHAIDDVVAALDEQAAVARRDDAGLLEALASGSPPARLAAARALGARRPLRVVDPLCRALDGCEEQVADGIVEALEQLGDERAVECLTAWAGEEPARLDRVVKATTRIGGTRSVAFLEKLAALEAAPRWLRENAKSSLTKFKRPPPEAGHDHSAEGHRPDDGLVKALSSDEREVRIGAAVALAETKRTDAVDALCELLDHPDPETSDAAVHALAEIGSGHGVPCLVRWSSNDERRLPLTIEALAMIGGPEARSVLELLARDHESREVRDLAAYGLSRLRTESQGQGR